MKMEEIRPGIGSRKSPKRVGRGQGSGHGKTATRGHKGQKARSGGKTKPGFEGGQMPIQRRSPKRGFRSPFPKEYTILNIKDIAALGIDTVTPEVLVQKGVIKSARKAVKILGDGELTMPVTVKAGSFSGSAIEKIKSAGGTAEVV